MTISGRPFQIAYSDTGAGGNFASEATGSSLFTLTAVPELGSFITMGLWVCCALGAARSRQTLWVQGALVRRRRQLYSFVQLRAGQKCPAFILSGARFRPNLVCRQIVAID